MIFFSLLSITNNAMSCSYASCFQKSVPSSTGNLWRRLGRLWKCEISAKCKVILSDIHWLSMDHHFKCTKLTWSAHDLKELDTIDGLISDPKHIVGNLFNHCVCLIIKLCMSINSFLSYCIYLMIELWLHQVTWKYYQ